MQCPPSQRTQAMQGFAPCEINALSPIGIAMARMRMVKSRHHVLQYVFALLGAFLLAGCAIQPVRNLSPWLPEESAQPKAEYSRTLELAMGYARRASRATDSAAGEWLQCATNAQQAMAAGDGSLADQAASLSTHCTERFLSEALKYRKIWSEGAVEIAGQRLFLELRDPSPNLASRFRIVLSTDVSMRMYQGRRNVRPGYGVPVALISKRCEGEPACRLLPVSGVFRSATAWIEAGQGGGSLLVLGHPDRTAVARVGARSWPLAMDSSAFYAAGLEHSPVGRLAIWSFFGGRAFGRRAGVYLLEDYAAEKCPLIMVHGLASTPLTWARLSNAVWADAELRERFQVWQLLYETNDPMLVARREVERHLDEAWATLDPTAASRARRCIVLVGHSMGGVIARLLSSDSGEVIWEVAFTKRRAELKGDSNDLDVVDRMFHFKPYPGIRRAILIASPHRGSPTADAMLGRIMHAMTTKNSPDIRALQRVARSNPNAVPEGLRGIFTRGRINSITTLRETEPVMRATHAILPAASIPYHTIAGRLPGTRPVGDGIVPLESALLVGAQSQLVVASGHNVHESEEAIAEVLRILHADRASDDDVAAETP